MRSATRVLLILCFSASLLAQTPPDSGKTVPIYRVTVVGRTVPAINYRSLSGSTQIDFRGTSLMPKASGKAEVTSKQSATRIQAEFKNMEPATTFGPEYLTYILWAITPDGRPANVAEIIPDGGKAKLDVSVNYQAFGLIVTAEPYFAVTMPSDVVVMQNVVTNDTVGKIMQINAKFQLLKRGQYTQNVSPDQVKPITMSPKTPLALYEAENAVNIARWADADQYAADTFNKAQQLLTQAQDYQARKAGKKSVIMTARESVQTAADARTIAIRREQQEQQTQEREAQAARAAAAKEKAEQEATARAQAEAAQQQAQAAQEQAEAARERAQAEAEQSKLAAQAASARAQQAENQRAQLRAHLLQQLNSILQTRQTPQGLVVTMSHVFFDTSKYTLHQETREMLAKLSGVLLAYPGITIRVNGYTDNTGSDETNQTLSENRANAVRDYLVQQGVPSASITAQGMGESNPVAPNDTTTGRALNRRVEIVITGDVIGIPVGSPAPSAAPAQ
ncbi:MAG TPA: OmpA family protein [Terriglobia bacterium]|nr:OmpA family protein [Terriglobia bacterium]